MKNYCCGPLKMHKKRKGILLELSLLKQVSLFFFSKPGSKLGIFFWKLGDLLKHVFQAFDWIVSFISLFPFPKKERKEIRKKRKKRKEKKKPLHVPCLLLTQLIRRNITCESFWFTFWGQRFDLKDCSKKLPMENWASKHTNTNK